MDGRCSVRFTRRLGAGRGEVWRALVEPESLGRWLARPLRLELSPGGAFELESVDGARLGGSVRSIEPGRVLELDWRVPGEPPSVVRFELSDDGSGTRLTLDHRLIDERLGMAYAARWERALERLEA